MKTEVKANLLVETNSAVSMADFIKMIKEYEEVPMVWIQWDCTERSLERRAILLADKILQIAGSKRIDAERLGVGFVNTQHGADTQAYMDEFVLYDMKNGNVEFRVIPYRKSADGKDRAHVYHVSAGWKNPVFSGRWPDVRKWFKQEVDNGVAAPAAEKKSSQKGPRDISQAKLPKSVKVPKREMARVVAEEQRTHETTEK